MRKITKKGNVLAENLVFIILNLVFISILLIYVTTKTNSASELEERYAKQIALMIDGAKADSLIFINSDELVKKMAKGYNKDDIIKIEDNIVTVKLSSRGGYSYAFFNDDLEVSQIVFLNQGEEHKNDYRITFKEKTNEEVKDE